MAISNLSHSGIYVAHKGTKYIINTEVFSDEIWNSYLLTVGK